MAGNILNKSRIVARIRNITIGSFVLGVGFVALFGAVGAYIIQTTRAATSISCVSFSALPAIMPGHTSVYTFGVRNNGNSSRKIIVDYGDGNHLFKEIDYGVVAPGTTMTKSIEVSTPAAITQVIAYAGSTSSIVCSKTVWEK